MQQQQQQQQLQMNQPGQTAMGSQQPTQGSSPVPTTQTSYAGSMGPPGQRQPPIQVSGTPTSQAAPPTPPQQKPAPQPAGNAAPTPPSMQVMINLQKKQNMMTPVSKPSGLDPLLLLSERENRVGARIAQRIGELEEMSAVMSDELQVQAMIELRALRLINFQRQVSTQSKFPSLIARVHWYVIFEYRVN